MDLTYEVDDEHTADDRPRYIGRYIGADGEYIFDFTLIQHRATDVDGDNGDNDAEDKEDKRPEFYIAMDKSRLNAKTRREIGIELCRQIAGRGDPIYGRQEECVTCHKYANNWCSECKHYVCDNRKCSMPCELWYVLENDRAKFECEEYPCEYTSGIFQHDHLVISIIVDSITFYLFIEYEDDRIVSTLKSMHNYELGWWELQKIGDIMALLCDTMCLERYDLPVESIDRPTHLNLMTGDKMVCRGCDQGLVGSDELISIGACDSSNCSPCNMRTYHPESKTIARNIMSHTECMDQLQMRCSVVKVAANWDEAERIIIDHDKTNYTAKTLLSSKFANKQ